MQILISRGVRNAALRIQMAAARSLARRQPTFHRCRRSNSLESTPERQCCNIHLLNTRSLASPLFCTFVFIYNTMNANARAKTN